MTAESALKMLEQYTQHITDPEDVLCGMRQRFPADGSPSKAMRWLGFVQGVLYERKVYTLDEIKQHSMLGDVPPPA